jgi:hypothetical protein
MLVSLQSETQFQSVRYASTSSGVPAEQGRYVRAAGLVLITVSRRRRGG